MLNNPHLMSTNRCYVFIMNTSISMFHIVDIGTIFAHFYFSIHLYMSKSIFLDSPGQSASNKHKTVRCFGHNYPHIYVVHSGYWDYFPDFYISIHLYMSKMIFLDSPAESASNGHKTVVCFGHKQSHIDVLES
jgi:hypothetical protein